MKAPQSKDDWNKVRTLYRVWAGRVKYWVPTSLYKIIAIVGIPLSVFFLYTGAVKIVGPRFGIIVIALTLVSVVQYFVRMDSETETYVEGFDQGIEYISGEYTLDDLIKTSENKARNDRKNISSD